jgi:hypothetical protein
MARKLVPLRIPSCWVVVFNIFVEFEDGEPISPEDAEWYLSDDILSIERVVLSDGRWVSEPGDWLLDLGWSAPGDVDGEYVLTVLHGGWDDPCAVFRSRSCRAVQQAIDLAFHEIIAGGGGIAGLSEAFGRLGSDQHRKAVAPENLQSG